MPTDEQLVAELRSLVASDLTPHYDTHFNLLRWIQANPRASMDKVAARLRHHLLFRKSSWDIESIKDKKRGYHPMHRFWPPTKCGMSGVVPNCMVYVEQTFSVAEIIKASLCDLEEMLADVMEIERETGQQASVMYIMDAEGIEYSKKLFDVMMRTMRSLSEFVAEHYVEMVSSIVVINAPSWANVLWAMVKPLLPERTRIKMNPSVCPSFWNNEQHTEFGLAMDRPIKVPNQQHTKRTEPLEKFHVKAGQVHWIERHLEKGDALTFHLAGNANFGFAIVLSETDGEDDAFAMRQVYPLISCVPGPLKVPIDDFVVAPQSGLYKLWFSNTKAWWSSLTVQLSVKVTKNVITE